MYEGYLRDLLAPLGIYDLTERSVSGAAVCALGTGLDDVSDRLEEIEREALTATAEDRARRRYAELTERGTDTDFDTVLRDIIARDEKDTQRAAAPLRQAEDAIAVDTHVERISKRLGLAKVQDSVEVVEQKLKRKLKRERWNRAHHLFIFFGRYFCTARNPKCEECPFKEFCKKDKLEAYRNSKKS